MRVRIAGRASFVYPDISVACGPPQFDASSTKELTITNPRLVVEVLSDSTESYDRGRKFDLYRNIPSLEEYVLVSQHEPLIESFLRQPDAAWLLKPSHSLVSSLLLRSLQVSIPTTEIYSGVEFEAESPTASDGQHAHD